MTSLERIIQAVSHGQPDHVPLDLGSSFTTGITKNACRRLCASLGFDGNPELYDVVQQLAVVPEKVLVQIGADVRGLIPNVVRKNPTVQDHGEYEQFEDEWGITWKRSKGGLYFSAVSTQLGGTISIQDIERFPWPDTGDPALFEGLTNQAQRWHKQGYAVILESVCAGIFEMAGRVRGVEQFYMDLALQPDLAIALMDKFVELKIRFYEAAARPLGPYVHFIREGDDVAGQESLLVSPQMYQEIIKPRHKQLFEAQKRFFPKPFYIWFHSDGAIFDLLPDFIEIGVEVLNPLQLTAKGMDAARIKTEYGKDLAFWGAGVNTQETLPYGTPDQVRQEVVQRMEILQTGGGFVLGTVHNIQDDVPVDNLIALLEAWREFRDYQQ
ncbi:MAG: hypothetical protein JW828_08595 [Sedimentisphaerales bacterium]|nr:hypothetical protein [Sedimentisphaerales bacterium]